MPSLLQPDLPRILLRPEELPRCDVAGLYVHIPFCFHKCHYCDFYSITRQTPERMSRFVDLLLCEADLWRGHSLQPRTVFFGGGTPSLLPLELMRRLVAGLRERFDLSKVVEWTVEVNPATADFDYCRMLREHGVDRLSFGAQSFDPVELKSLERHHHPDDVHRSVEIAAGAGFGRVNLDLIFGIPGQTPASWQRSLERAISFGTSHLSAYSLTYEPNTPLAVLKRLGTIKPVDEQIELAMLQHARAALRAAGMPPYETSNFAVPGQECRHNLLYWNGESYVGLGPSAASHLAGTRFKNLPHLGEWESAVSSGHLPAADVEHLTPDQRGSELIMLQLRLTHGVSSAGYAALTGRAVQEDFARQLDALSRNGLIDIDKRGFRLTEAAIAVSDSVAAEFVSR